MHTSEDEVKFGIFQRFCSVVQSLYALRLTHAEKSKLTKLKFGALKHQGHLWCILKQWTTFQMMQSSPRCKRFATCAASTKDTQAPNYLDVLRNIW